MTQNLTIMKKEAKQRVTAFVDPALIKRAKVRGALEGLTISEVVEKALDAYAPKIEKTSGEHIQLRFASSGEAHALISKAKSKGTLPTHTKFRPPVPR